MKILIKCITQILIFLILFIYCAKIANNKALDILVIILALAFVSGLGIIFIKKENNKKR